MRSRTTLSAVALGSFAASQLVVPFHRNPARSPVSPSLARGDDDQRPLQNPLGPGPAMPPSDPSSDAPLPSTGPGSVMLSDVIGRDRSINIFAGLTRSIESVSQRLDDASQNSIVLAPLNSAVEKLPRKPWEDARDYGAFGENAYEGGDGQDRAQRNLRRFVEAHIVPVSPWPAGHKAKTVGDDKEIWWEHRDDGVKVVGHSFFALGLIKIHLLTLE
jgi:paired amphipathic helix protein Sin3a